LNKKAYAFFLKKNRPRNTIAQQLNDGRYQPRVVKSKKVYDRKKIRKIQRRSGDGEMSDV
tara:strand:+ start:247 stop:426 length:180 start_codon:yes stop_codon:yes gene_type:complete